MSKYSFPPPPYRVYSYATDHNIGDSEPSNRWQVKNNPALIREAEQGLKRQTKGLQRRRTGQISVYSRPPIKDNAMTTCAPKADRIPMVTVRLPRQRFAPLPGNGPSA